MRGPQNFVLDGHRSFCLHNSTEESIKLSSSIWNKYKAVNKCSYVCRILEVLNKIKLPLLVFCAVIPWGHVQEATNISVKHVVPTFKAEVHTALLHRRPRSLLSCLFISRAIKLIVSSNLTFMYTQIVRLNQISSLNVFCLACRDTPQVSAIIFCEPALYQGLHNSGDRSCLAEGCPGDCTCTGAAQRPGILPQSRKVRP